MMNSFAERMRVSGLETENACWIREKLAGIFDEVCVDQLGNVFAKNKKDPAKKDLLLATHWDEPGFVVTKITAEGYLKFESVGKIPVEAMLSKKVDIDGHTGVISLKAIHLSTREEREKPVVQEKLFVDIGADSREKAQRIVTEGDYFAFEQDICEIGNDRSGRGMDSAAAMEILLAAAEKIENYNVTLVFYAQHHVGMRGLRAAAVNLEADVCVLLEGVDWKRKRRENSGGAVKRGNALCFATKNYLAPRKLHAKAEMIAHRAEIPIESIATELSDEAEFFAARGIPVIYIGLNCRYQNTAVCAVNKMDIEDAKRLIIKISEEINEDL